MLSVVSAVFIDLFEYDIPLVIEWWNNILVESSEKLHGVGKLHWPSVKQTVVNKIALEFLVGETVYVMKLFGGFI